MYSFLANRFGGTAGSPHLHVAHYSATADLSLGAGIATQHFVIQFFLTDLLTGRRGLYQHTNGLDRDKHCSK